MKYQKLCAVFLLHCAVLFTVQTSAANYPSPARAKIFSADKFFRTELYFGMDKPDGGEVSDEDWNGFLNSEVTPRFPAGFTVLEGYGQFKDSSDRIVREESRVLVLFYPKKERQEVNQKIEELRAVYKKRFNQESVLRLDFTKSVKVTF